MRRTARRPARAAARRRSAARRPRPAPRATLLLHPGVLGTIACAVASAGDLETGGPLIGTVQRSWDGDAGPPRQVVSVLGTVPPGPALRASEGWVSMGPGADGERAASAIRWWRAVTGLELLHLGDWHKHDAALPEPSAGDRETARRMAAETAAPLWLAAVAIGEHSEKSDTDTEGNCVQLARTVADSEQVRFYRADAVAGLTPMPLRLERDALPALPALPWHVVDPGRFASECRLLAGAGFGVAIEPSDAGARPGLLLRLRSRERPGLTVVTGPDYPAEPPVIRDASGRRVRAAGPWSAGRFLADLLTERSCSRS
jgi:hypothetical protein